MSDFQTHKRQAINNQELADKLREKRQDNIHYDWSVTCSFYAALHYFECWVYNNLSEKHSRINKPNNISAHEWREHLIRKNLSKEAWKIYRKLKEKSTLARYLYDGRNEMNDIAKNLMTLSDVDKHFDDLIEFKNELGIS